MHELTIAEAQYVDQMASTIISRLIATNPNAYNTEYFKVLGQTAYQLALVMLEVRTEKVSIVETTLAQAVDNAIEVVKEISDREFSPTPAPLAVASVAHASVPIAETEPEAIGISLGEQIDKVVKKAKKKGGRPKGTKNNKNKKKKATKTKKPHKKNVVEPLTLS